jgi:hypothetical protein
VDVVALLCRGRKELGTRWVDPLGVDLIPPEKKSGWYPFNQLSTITRRIYHQPSILKVKSTQSPSKEHTLPHPGTNPFPFLGNFGTSPSPSLPSDSDLDLFNKSKNAAWGLPLSKGVVFVSLWCYEGLCGVIGRSGV